MTFGFFRSLFCSVPFQGDAETVAVQVQVGEGINTFTESGGGVFGNFNDLSYRTWKDFLVEEEKLCSYASVLPLRNVVLVP